MIKTSKIQQVVNSKEFTNSFGTTIYHNLVMENGDKINIGKKKLQQTGWELTYEIIGDKKPDGSYQQEYPKAKAAQKEEFNVGSNTYSNSNTQYSSGYQKVDDYKKGIEIGHAVNNAVNLICAGVELDVPDYPTTDERIEAYARRVLEITNKLKSE